MSLVLAFDLGGTRLKAGLVDPAAGTVVHRSTTDVAGADLAAGLAALTAAGTGLLATAGLAAPAAVGLAVPGVVDGGRITVLPGKLAGAEGVDLAGWLREVFHADAVAVANDARANAVGELSAWREEGLDRGRVLVLTIGTGIGCALLEDGLPALEGPWGGGMLGGHVPVGDPVGPLDTAGRPGTFEARCRAERIAGEVRDAGLDVADVPAALAAHAAGDPAAVAGITAYRGWFVRGLAALTHAYAPSHVLVGGGPMTAEGPLLDGVQEALAGLVWAGTCPRVRPTRLGVDAALLGIAGLATADVATPATQPGGVA